VATIDVPRATGARPAEPVAERRTPAIKVWAAVGVVFAAITVYALTRWIALGHVHASPQGDTSHVSSWTWFWVRANEVLVVSVTVAVQYWFVYRPWRRTGRLSWDGIFCIAFTGLWLQDPLSNSGKIWLQYSSLFVNLGCWQCHAPGWLPSHPERFTEPILFIGVMYAGFLPAWAIFTSWTMRKAKERWPQLGTLGLVGIAIFVAGLIDYILEVPWLQMNLYAFPGSIHWWSIFPGSRTAMPFNEGLTMGLFAGGAGCLRYFRNDQGLSLADRGLGSVNWSPRRKRWLQLIAVYGALQTIMLVGYTMPNYWLSLHGGARPTNAYSDQLTNLMCGPQTNQACPGPGVPSASGPHSAFVTPSGKLHLPPGFRSEDQLLKLHR
jgi:Spirocyclase AveC-like